MGTVRRIVVTVLVAAVLGGCTTVVDGAGSPAAPVSPGASGQGSVLPGPGGPTPPASAGPGFPGPPRPRDLPVDGVEPCELLTAAQRVELGLDGEPQRYESDTGLFGEALACSISRFTTGPALSVGIVLSDTYGLERFYEPDVQPPVEPAVVDGYAAVISRPRPSMPDNCEVAVDVAPGQMLGVLLRDGGSARTIPLDELCREAPRYAAAVLATLRDR